MPVNFPPGTAWIILVIAGVLEIVWAVSMKASAGFTKHNLTALTLVAAFLSFVLLGLAMRALPVGTAYAVWTGIGAVGAAVLGIIIFGESPSLARLGCIALIIVGILGLKLVSSGSAA